MSFSKRTKGTGDLLYIDLHIGEHSNNYANMSYTFSKLQEKINYLSYTVINLFARIEKELKNLILTIKM